MSSSSPDCAVSVARGELVGGQVQPVVTTQQVGERHHEAGGLRAARLACRDEDEGMFRIGQRQYSAKAARQCHEPAVERDVAGAVAVQLGMSRPGPKIPPLSVTDAQRAVLEGWVRRRSTAQALAADRVRTWRRRFIERGLDGLSDEPRPGAPRKISDADVERVIVKTLEERPKNATHWSTRSMAAATGMSQSAISRIWRAFALAPHRSETFKLSTDPFFIDKVRDVVGLYLCIDPQRC